MRRSSRNVTHPLRVALRAPALLAVLTSVLGALAATQLAAGDPGTSSRRGAGVAYGDGGITIVRPDGRERRRVTSSDGDYQPSWSPDGRFLAFRSDRAEPGPNEGVVIVNVLSRRERRLTRGRLAGFPAWAPRGGLIAFSGTVGTYVVSVSGEGRRLVFANGEWPTWSPDGTRLALISPEDGNTEIHSVEVATQTAQNLTQTPSDEEAPAWSPDGREIAFISDRDGNDELYVMRSDGDGVRRLTHTPAASEGFPVWTNDGSIVFARYRRGATSPRVFLAARDGTHVRRLHGIERAGIRFPIALFRVSAASLS